jgi:predicted nucleotidyltransferase
MPGPIEHVLAALNDAGVRYLIVGGVAVVLHGHLRATADLDLVVRLEDDNARRAVEALAVPDRPGLEVDLFVEEPFDYEAVAARALAVRLDSIEVPLIALDDLIAMKEGVDRPRDREDVLALRALRERRGTPESGR